MELGSFEAAPRVNETKFEASKHRAELLVEYSVMVGDSSTKAHFARLIIVLPSLHLLG